VSGMSFVSHFRMIREHVVFVSNRKVHGKGREGKGRRGSWERGELGGGPTQLQVPPSPSNVDIPLRRRLLGILTNTTARRGKGEGDNASQNSTTWQCDV
jgi:hypothetical protein